MKNFITLTLFAVTILTSCDSISTRRKLKAFMKEKVSIPELLCVHGEKTSIYNSEVNSPKLVIYYDSLSCSDCEVSRLVNTEWLYEKSLKENKFEVLIIFSPLAGDSEALLEMLYRQNFKYPVYLDMNGAFRETNSFLPADKRFHSFLLNKDGDIKFVGNPMMSKELDHLFFKVLEQEL